LERNLELSTATAVFYGGDGSRACGCTTLLGSIPKPVNDIKKAPVLT
jgi:hypothetical protein